MPLDTSKVSDNSRLKSAYTGDTFLERYCKYLGDSSNVLLVAPRDFVEDMSETSRVMGSLYRYNGNLPMIPVWFGPCEYDRSFFNFQADNGSLIFTYMRGVDKDLLSSDKSVYVSMMIAGVMKDSTILIKPAIPKFSSSSLEP